MNPATYALSADQRQTYRRYAGLALPRHTSYPIASAWNSAYGAMELRADLGRTRDIGRQISIYVHIPFCERLCYFCACTKEIVSGKKRKLQDPSPQLVADLEVEADHFADAIGPCEVHQVHFGGGSPTFLAPEQLERLWNVLTRRFAIASYAEIAVEVDPRITTRAHLETLRRLGFNRISLGVQDFSLQVQKAINRIQPYEIVQQFVAWCRELNFESLNFDLIYGLPLQTPESMADTLERTVALSPDRIAFYRLAVIPEMFRWQNVFRDTDLPSGDLSLELNLFAINKFLQAGYEFIGLDHFAKPSEPLARARHAGSLHRNFQGMTTGKSLDTVGLGPSAISQSEFFYAQNRKTTEEWRAAISIDFATVRGIHLGDDDRLRRELLQQLYCNGAVEKRELETRFGICFEDYFADELVRLGELVDEGIAVDETDAIRLTEPLGRLLLRVVAAIFDSYLPATTFRNGLPAHLSSKVG